MSTPYIGQITMFGGNFAPINYAFCKCQPIAISDNEALYNLIGTTFGGDGVNTFNLPDLQCRLPVHQGRALGSVELRSWAEGRQRERDHHPVDHAGAQTHVRCLDRERYGRCDRNRRKSGVGYTDGFECPLPMRFQG